MSQQFTVLLTPAYRSWYDGLRDHRARGRIDARIRRVKAGNLGDHKEIGGGLCELRIDVGPGYRLYYAIRGQSVVLLLAGRTKGSQSADILRSRALLAELDTGDGH